MAVEHWAVLTIEQTLTHTGYKIEVTTDIPAHLFMRWSTTEPQIHKKAILKRGIFIRQDLRYCFVVFTDNEQGEAGDTLHHTFIKEPWPVCETRYFYFHGTVNGNPTPSTSPIFTKHRAEMKYDLILFEPWHLYGPPPPPFVMLLLEEWTS